jgi:hypothetical protein
MDASPQGSANTTSGGEREAPRDAEAAAAWYARYSEYIQRSIARAGRAQDLNREVIRRVAAGQLAPATLESHLSTFAAVHAFSYAEQVANITMAFLVGLIRAGSAYAHELVRVVLPGAVPPPELDAPEFERGKSADWFRDLTLFAAAENVRVTAMLRMVMEKVEAGELTPAEVQQVSSEFHAEHLLNSTSRLVELYLDLLTGLEEAHAAFSEQYLQSLMGADHNRAAQLAGAAEIDAVLGQSTSIRFAVTNTDPGPVVVECTLSEIRRADGVGPAFDPVADTTPRRLELLPDAEATVELRIHADASHFQPGTLYDGVFRVASATRTLLELPLRIRAVAPEPTPGPPSPDQPSAGMP